MTLRPATADDVPAMIALLRRHEASSMFPLARLGAAGLGGAGPHAIDAWLAEAAGHIDGMVAISAAGMLLPQLPLAVPAPQLRAALAGRRVTGAIGPAEQVSRLLSSLGLGDAKTRHDGIETGFVLDLADLVLPPAQGRLIRPGMTERAAMIVWRAAYLSEIFATPVEEAIGHAPADVDRWLAADSHRLLEVAGTPVAMSGFNARLPEVVQIGGVYVPPGLRGRGHARRVVAQHLAEARAEGVRRAALFAVSPAAIRAYSSIGFREQGRMALVLFATPQEVAP